MLIRRNALLLAIAAATCSTVVASGAWAMSQPLPGTGYVWAQPSTSLAGVTSAEPRLVTAAASMLPVGAYLWAQPDASLVGVTSTQP